MVMFAVGCTPKPAPAPVAPPPTVVVVTPTPPPPTPDVEAEPEVPARPSAVHLDEGWVRNADDPSAPLIQLVVAEDYGDRGKKGVDTIVGAADSILACWEHAVSTEPRRASVNIRWRAPSEPDDDPLEINTGPATEVELGACVDAAVRKVVSRPEGRDFAVVTFQMFPRRDAVVLPRADERQVVAVRAGGSCWQWVDEPPCPPKKRCYVDRWERTACGDPPMRDDVSVRFGLGTPASGRAPLIDLRLVGGDGAVLWLARLPSAFVNHYGRYDVAEGPSVDATRGAYAVKFGAASITLADSGGIQVFDRRTGDRQLTWVAPERGERTLWFDDGTFSIRRGQQTCEGDAGHGAFFAECGDRSVFFDGYTLAVFSGAPLTLVASRHLGQRGNSLTGSGVAPQAALAAGGVRVSVRGTVFMH